MLGNFTYSNPTRLHFGNKALDLLTGELQNYGPKVMLAYGGGSIKRNGIYDQVVRVLKDAGKTIIEEGGVMPNPDIEKVLEGARTARRENVDLILAVGGGSTSDFAKAVAASAWQEHDVWQYYFKEHHPCDCRWIPVGVVLTMAGTGSEMNSGSVISSHKEEQKLFDYFHNPDFAVLNPEFTFTLPQYQMVAGIYDIMSHILEQYLSGTDDNTSDYIAEGLMRSLVASSRKALKNPRDYEARSNIMWTATWALNGLTECGKATDWEVHMLGQGLAAVTNATHGHTLAAVSDAYYRLIIEKSNDAAARFKRFAANVWGIPTGGKDNKTAALEGLEAMEAWMRTLGLAMNISQCGGRAEDIDKYCNATFINTTGYYTLTPDDVKNIFRNSL
jgi:alcohol dehydrogenase YqhD (iron-dependent ADH family)